MSDCFVFEVSWYKNLGGKEEHEFLRFDILSPDEKHVAIVIAERGRDAAQFTETAAAPVSSGTILTPPLTPPEIAIAAPTSPDVARDSSLSSAEESSPPLRKANKTSGKAAEEAVKWEHEQREVAEENAKAAREAAKAADKTAKWECKQCEVAEENAKAADETAKREREQREAAEAANMKLLQELEAFRRATARNSLSKLHSSVS
ncbi:hypothetical protein BKA82DRAFT_25582 [Pisolithus tinctorius]|uniref:Uncharacterized protein n=1 Tax=Pisolithus tinctorius Marx 270 TaxID=870435 RepID=A0A0C3J8V2_PISTI|nr:hypothetical protein BKA82DRAFT_25582 [Pisolithus tinctorius]KIO05463.1 hypothetical protein M404DRAFT_25582 [Pisolithus tinctorius Marx 270]